MKISRRSFTLKISAWSELKRRADGLFTSCWWKWWNWIGDLSTEYRRFATLCEPQNILLVSGKVEVRNERKSILVSDMVAATDIKEQYYYLRLERSLAEKTRQQLWQILRAHHGDVPVIIIEENENRKIILQENLWLRPDESTKEALTTLLGSKNVVLKWWKFMKTAFKLLVKMQFLQDNGAQKW